MSGLRGSSLRIIAGNLALALTYAAVASITLLIARYTGLAAPVWPAAGIAFAVVYLRGPTYAPGIALGSLIVNSTTLLSDGHGVATSLTIATAIGIGAALEAGVGGHLVKRLLGTHLSLSRGGQVVAFLLLAGPVACVINPTVGVAAQLIGGVLPANDALLGWLTWWVGDSVGVIVFAPLALMAFPEQADIWRHRQWKVAVPSLIAVLILGGAFLQNSALEQEQIDLQRDNLAESAGRDLRESLARNEEVLRGLRGLFEADEFVTRTEFDIYTRDSIPRFPNLQALSWNPVVTQAQLPAFIDRQISEEGLPGFQVTERGPDGTLQPVSDRPDYVVVDYIEPMSTNAPAIGYDIKSSPERAEAIQRATDTGEPAATAPIDLVQGSGAQKGMLLLLPVFSGDAEPPNTELRRAQVQGFAVGVYELGNVLAATFDGNEWRDIALRMYDATDSANPILLAEQGSTLTPDAGNTSSVTIDVAGRIWRLDVTPASQVLGNPAAAPAYLLAGLLIVFLLQAFVLLVTGMERQARRQADASHYDASHDPLTELMNRRAFIERMSDVRLRSEEEGARHVLMYLDLDGFKAVNDRGGHDAGDRCLREIAQRFAECVRGGDTVARLGGDEFAVILNDCPVERGLDVARQLVNAAHSYRPFPNDPGLVVGVSIGVTTIAGSPPPSLDALLHEADTACYQAKRQGKGHVRLYQPDAATT